MSTIKPELIKLIVAALQFAEKAAGDGIAFPDVDPVDFLIEFSDTAEDVSPEWTWPQADGELPERVRKYLEEHLP